MKLALDKIKCLIVTRTIDFFLNFFIFQFLVVKNCTRVWCDSIRFTGYTDRLNVKVFLFFLFFYCSSLKVAFLDYIFMFFLFILRTSINDAKCFFCYIPLGKVATRIVNMLDKKKKWHSFLIWFSIQSSFSLEARTFLNNLIVVKKIYK